MAADDDLAGREEATPGVAGRTVSGYRRKGAGAAPDWRDAFRDMDGSLPSGRDFERLERFFSRLRQDDGQQT